MKLRRKGQAELARDPHEPIVEQTRDIASRIRHGMASVEERDLLEELADMDAAEIDALFAEYRARYPDRST